MRENGAQFSSERIFRTTKNLLHIRKEINFSMVNRGAENSVARLRAFVLVDIVYVEMVYGSANANGERETTGHSWYFSHLLLRTRIYNTW